MKDRILAWVEQNYLRAALITLAVVAVISSLALCSVAKADTVTFTFTAPTQREDGTALTAAEIANYRLVWTLNGVPQTDVLVAGNVLAYVLNTATPGKVCGTLATIDTDGLESVPTGQVCRKAKPNPPGNARAK